MMVVVSHYHHFCILQPVQSIACVLTRLLTPPSLRYSLHMCRFLLLLLSLNVNRFYRCSNLFMYLRVLLCHMLTEGHCRSKETMFYAIGSKEHCGVGILLGVLEHEGNSNARYF